MWKWKMLVQQMMALVKLLWHLEEKFFHRVLRLYRGEYSVTLNDINVLHESPFFIVVDKHHDVIMNAFQRDSLHHQVTLEKQLERLYPDLYSTSLPFGFYHPHRLDYATSGIICIAKTKKACGAAGNAFANRNTKKFYLAIVRGHLSKDFVTIEDPIGEDSRKKFKGIRMAGKSMKYCSDTTRYALTHLAVLERGVCYGYPATKVLLRPITGRRHQLRIHCSTLGHTIVGDFTYSDRRDIAPYRMFLHSFKLQLACPLEFLDLTTEDPFVEQNPRNNWKSHEQILSINDAIYELSQK